MDALATIADVNRILDPSVEADEEAAVELLLEEASDVVQAWVGRDFTVPVPGVVTRVVARMVARALGGGGQEPVGMAAESHSAGVFTRSRTFEPGATDGGVWLSRQDKIRLRRWRGGAFTVKTW